jgi:hypothetical protein
MLDSAFKFLIVIACLSAIATLLAIPAKRRSERGQWPQSSEEWKNLAIETLAMTFAAFALVACAVPMALALLYNLVWLAWQMFGMFAFAVVWLLHG